jgi:N-acetylneuraminic acid mutarotase
LIDDFVAAYNGRDALGLEALVVAPRISDLSVAPHAGAAQFDGVLEWAEAGWDVGDKLRLAGYSAFAGGPGGFAMLAQRTNRFLRDAGIDSLSITLAANSSGCEITELSLTGPIQASPQPCLFFDTFADVPEVSAGTPAACADGSGRFARTGHAAAWTGREMLLVGGSQGGHHTEDMLLGDGLSYVPSEDRWAVIPPMPGPPISPAIAEWTGRELLVLGAGWDAPEAGAAYDPAAGRWRSLPPLPDGVGVGAGVWSGQELLVWGGGLGDRLTRVGAAYDPDTDSWRRLPPSPITGRYDHTAVWTGREMIVWGGTDYDHDLGDGAAYDPGGDTWRKIAEAPVEPRVDHTAAWTGREMIVYGGTYVSDSLATGVAYDPVTDTWRRIAPAPIDGRHRHSAVWTGEAMIVFGGYGYPRHEALPDGAAYDPAADAWTPLPRAPLGARCDHTAVWTGEAMVVFGGYHDCGSPGHPALGDGAAYRPDAGTWERIIPSLPTASP